VVSPVRVRISPLGNPHGCGIYCFSDCVGEAIIGYSIGLLAPVYFELETESPVLIGDSGLVRDEVTTISVVVGNAGRTSRQEINVGLSTLERDVLDGRLEIHVVP
jgi:hypothetical protein